MSKTALVADSPQVVFLHAVPEGCASCGVAFAMESTHLQQRRDDGQPFFCPNGHQLSFRETKARRLEKELAEERRRREAAELQRNAARELLANADAERDRAQLTVRQTTGKLRAIKKRIKNGVCPCCQRSFVDLQRHMTTQHPSFAEEGK